MRIILQPRSKNPTGTSTPRSGAESTTCHKVAVPPATASLLSLAGWQQAQKPRGSQGSGNFTQALPAAFSCQQSWWPYLHSWHARGINTAAVPFHRADPELLGSYEAAAQLINLSNCCHTLENAGSLGKLGSLRVRRLKEESASIYTDILMIRRVKHSFWCSQFLLKRMCYFQNCLLTHISK